MDQKSRLDNPVKRELPLSQGFLPALEGLRAVAAVGVLTTHVAFLTGSSTGTFVHRVWGRFDLWVAVFFALSGFLLWRKYAVLAHHGGFFPSTTRYFRSRIMRIFPAYLCCVLFVLVILPEAAGADLQAWLTNLTLTQIYVPYSLVGGLTHMWSLSVEVSFYVVLPFLGLMLSFYRGRPEDTGGVVRPLAVQSLTQGGMEETVRAGSAQSLLRGGQVEVDIQGNRLFRLKEDTHDAQFDRNGVGTKNSLGTKKSPGARKVEEERTGGRTATRPRMNKSMEWERWRIPVITLCGLLSLGWAFIPLPLESGMNQQLQLPGFLPWFCVGLVLAELVVSKRTWIHRLAERRSTCYILGALCFLIAVTPLAGPEGMEHPSNAQFSFRIFLGALVALFFLAPLTIGETGQGHRILGSPVFQALGRWSYSIFLWHLAVLSFVFPMLGIAMFQYNMLIVWPITVIGAVAISAASYALIEAPLGKAYHSWERRRQDQRMQRTSSTIT